MTPCEKLGYKVGDKFEVVADPVPYCESFKIGTVITLKADDGSWMPEFTGDHPDGDGYGFCSIDRIKPVSQRVTKPISKSKRQLAQLLIEAGVTQFPEGANWAAQDKDGSRYPSEPLTVMFYNVNPTKPKKGVGYWFGDGGTTDIVGRGVQLPTLIPNWHQTVLSRDEFDQIVAETVVRSEPQYCESVVRSIPEPTATPALDQLLQDWRNADDYAQRKQTEADEAAAMRDERWKAVQARAGEMGVTVGVRGGSRDE